MPIEIHVVNEIQGRAAPGYIQKHTKESGIWQLPLLQDHDTYAIDGNLSYLTQKFCFDVKITHMNNKEYKNQNSCVNHKL